ncbi:MAG: hypothetical protein CL670_06010 [Balneola sp.]|jgi:predicted lysophospholipase L1 biosynthesis ABC-type transport system permease subunit|nr:hypothetical protein [Balneola sp.]MBE78690.1 hypothetical protein [Balneola sp.]|tara:strand:- start:312 stop:917 length:606 start_codon:yes stop_codon:yes gene_type:complete
MKEQQDYIQDIAEIRSMMERSSKFLSLSGWAGIMAGIYALAGAYVAYAVLEFNPDAVQYSFSNLTPVVLLALGILVLALITAVLFSRRKASDKGEQVWNATSRRLLASMAVPLSVGGALVLMFIVKGLIGLAAPFMLIFYGLALYNAGSYTIKEVKFMGFAQILLGLMNIWFIEFGILFWTIGFGVIHLIYGIYMYFRFER